MSTQPQPANVWQSILIILLSIWVTAVITFKTIFEVYRGVFKRHEGDERLRWWSGKLLSFVNLQHEVNPPHGFHFEEGKRYIIMSNHLSYYDIPVIFMSLPGSIRMLTKKELFRVPIWGTGMRVGEFISVDRKDRNRAIQDLQVARAKMESGIILWVAPEGTRSRSGKLGKFKKGGFHLAFDTGAIILPVGINGTRNVMPADTYRFAMNCKVTVNIGEPIDTADYSKENKQELMDLVREKMTALLDEETQRIGS